MTPGSPDWVADAKSLPIAFAQVREDPLLDFQVLARIGRRARVLMIASGGCTAAALAARRDVESLHLVDPKPAQLALARVKLHLLETADPAERMLLLGHASLEIETRANRIHALLDRVLLPLDVLGPIERLAAYGLDHAGRYEQLFAALRRALAPFAPSLDALLALSDPQDQASRVRPDAPLGRALDSAFLNTMALTNLVALFGEEATRNPREPFATHFTGRLRRILATQPAAGNPFLSQMLLGRFRPGVEHFWLRIPAGNPLPAVSWDVSPMVPVLSRRRNEFDMIHLSNILDWLSPEEARETLELAWSALRPGGWVIVRQLNSVLDIPALCPRFSWHDEASAALLDQDRSFFYRAIWIAERK